MALSSPCPAHAGVLLASLLTAWGRSDRIRTYLALPATFETCPTAQVDAAADCLTASSSMFNRGTRVVRSDHAAQDWVGPVIDLYFKPAAA